MKFTSVLLIFVVESVRADLSDCKSGTDGSYNDFPCVIRYIKQAKLRVLYLESDYTVLNNAAKQEAADLGIEYTCSDPSKSLRSW